MTNTKIPILENNYYFFDDGKTSPSRCYKAKVINIIPYNKCDKVFEIPYEKTTILKSLKEIHKDEVDSHRQSGNLKILSKGASTEPGSPWLYAEKTDFFIECEIPGYDENNIWFARDVSGGWFSLEIQDNWQSGRLDVNNSIYEDAKHHFDMYSYDGHYDTILIEKGEFIYED